MKVNGIIAEYNPFHNGHRYHLEEAARITGADYTIIAMSGNFMQRGTPAILNKYARTEMALKNGADLVLEIPSFYACGSAEYFATGAVAMLDKLGVVDYLCFGSECGEENLLGQIAQILIDEPESYKSRLRVKLRQGYSFPMARSLALLEYCPSLSGAIEVFSSPNNILGIEYIKALLRRGSSILPSTTKRVGSDYHDKRLGTHQSSALALRHAIFSKRDLNLLREQMPESAHDILMNVWTNSAPIHSNDFSLPLHYKLLAEASSGYSQYVDVTSDLSDRIRKNIYNFINFKSFCDLLKSKDLTYARISRSLLHILLDMKDETLEFYKTNLDYVPYARVLGFRREAAPLLSAIKENSSIPMLSKLADADKVLGADALDMLRKDVEISNVYNCVAAHKTRQTMVNEYGTALVIL